MSSDEESALDEQGHAEEDFGDLSDVLSVDKSNDQDEVQEEDECSWPDRETSKLIDLFRENSQLYDVSHKWYSHRERKLATLTNMATEMECSSKYIYMSCSKCFVCHGASTPNMVSYECFL
jgi:hypothetical protein